MSDLVLAEKDPAVIVSECLARYKEITGVDLAPADPRRLHLQTMVLLLTQQRSLIDFAGKQSLLRFVSDDWIDILAELWGESRLPALPSTTTMQFHFPTGSSFAPRIVPAGVRVTDDTNTWEVLEDVASDGPASEIEVLVYCTVTGSASNGVAIGQIDDIANPDLIPDCQGVTNLTETAKGRDLEAPEDFRTRLRDVPESRSTCGPRLAYKAAALETSPTVADAAVLGPDDGAEVAQYAPDPGEVFVLILEGERDENGVLTSVVPEPTPGLIAAVDEALSAEDVRPLTDFVTVQAPLWQDFDAIATYYIPRSRQSSAASIKLAVEAAFEAYLLWQQSSIGRDINPDEMRTRIVNAGAKRLVVTEPAYTALLRDQAARNSYAALVYGGVEDD